MEKELTNKEAESLAREIYPQGDNFYARRTKGGGWILGYTNDYPLQHGNGEQCVIPQKLFDMAYATHHSAELLNENEKLKQALVNLFKQNEWSKLDDRPLVEYEKIVEARWQQFKTDNNL